MDEIGTVAAAGTRVSLEFKSFSTRPPLIITIDRPFLFVLHQNDNVLFSGRVAHF